MKNVSPFINSLLNNENIYIQLDLNVNDNTYYI